MVKADASGGRRPDLAAEILPDIVHLVAGQSILCAIVHPRSVQKAVQTAVARHPDVSVKNLEAKVPGRTRLNGLCAKPAISEFSKERLDPPTGGRRNRFKTLRARIEQQRVAVRTADDSTVGQSEQRAGGPQPRLKTL